MPRPRIPLLIPSVSIHRITRGSGDFLSVCASLKMGTIRVSVRAPVSDTTLNVGQTLMIFLFFNFKIVSRIQGQYFYVFQIPPRSTACTSTSALTPFAAERMVHARKSPLSVLAFPCHVTRI